MLIIPCVRVDITESVILNSWWKTAAKSRRICLNRPVLFFILARARKMLRCNNLQPSGLLRQSMMQHELLLHALLARPRQHVVALKHLCLSQVCSSVKGAMCIQFNVFPGICAKDMDLKF
jgi:hypothetical protein